MNPYLFALLITGTGAVFVGILWIWSSGRRRHTIRGLTRLGHDLGKAPSSEAVYKSIFKNCQEVVPAEIFGIARVYFQKGYLQYEYLIDRNESREHREISIDEDSRYEIRTVKENEPLLFRNLSAENRDDWSITNTGKLPVSAVYIPLSYLTDCLAVIVLQSRHHRFTGTQVRQLERLTPFMGVFLQSARNKVALEDTVQKKTSELKKKNQELKNTIERLNKTQNQLITSEKLASLGKLVAGVAHEINTPVGSSMTGITHISSMTKRIINMLENDDLSREDLEEYLSETTESSRIIEQELNRASHLIRSFKQVSADRSSEIRRAFAMKPYINDVILSMRNIIKKRDVSIELNCSENLVIESYPGAYSQILNNLIMNALIHGIAPEDKGLIRIDVTEQGDDIVITFRDNGKGISAKDLKKIFDPFFTTAHDQGGTGLGLNIVYNIVTNTLQGVIECESRLQEGTVFTLTFPKETEREELDNE